ncbi:glucose sorbosone dehydrogenase [Arthrobacter sp. MYb23]|uniref:PQQ-dependent sugar dehydrogenase n=1 Tax=unclassified Arthrobacter TaxID=235627 RepID=UPI000CFC2526|nr:MULTISPECIES: PQQ-dependent sugar dehydrogenase [unclassified Arthrobacter]PRB40477.1 glucose sorbosone dehydrogenase [Arthrobacter sp. MYb51]PRB98415.1 glucose sorbosone dehydrogenase [Arthrobacter sp. MYb23]
MNTGRHSSERRGHLVPARAVTLLLALTIVLAGCTGSPSSPGTAATPETPTSQGTAPAQGGPPTPGSPSTGVGQATPASPQIPEVVRKLDVGLQLPWSVVFLPDGTAVVSERDSAQVKSIRDGQTATVGEVPGVDPGGEGGLLGLALSPGFATDRWLYAYFTAPDDNRIARIKITGDPAGSLALGEAEVIFSGMPKASTHNGGRIRFGPDGFLYVGTGDSQRREQPQDTNALGGKILRLTAEGRPAPGNPFGNNPVYSYGHRNVQGLAWDSDGRLWASEFGPDVDDELNLITPGGNYGWPTVTGAPGRSGLIDAKVVWPSTSDASPSGLEIVEGVAYTGALRGQRLWAVPLDGETAGSPVAYFTGQYGRLRDVARAPDGTLWVISNNRNPDFALILRVAP